MPPATKRNACVILYDVNTSQEFAEAAKKCLLDICTSKWFVGSNDIAHLVLLNSQETKNPIQDKFGKCPHVYQATEAVGYDPKLFLPHLQDVQRAKGNWLMGLAVALELIKENFYNAKGVMNLQILFITQLTTTVEAKENRIAFITQNLNKMNIFLYILGPHVKIPQQLVTFNDVKCWSRNIEFLSDDDNPNYKIVKKIVEETNTVVCDLDLGKELFKSYWSAWSLQAWKVPLTIGSLLTANCTTTRFLREASGPKLTALTVTGFKEPWKWHLTEDLLMEVAHEDVIGGYVQHGTFIPLPADIEKIFKYNGPRCFKIVGFTEKSSIPQCFMRGTGSCYVESDNSKSFELLVHVLAKQNKCAIARRVYMANCSPKLVVLIPDAQRRIFVLVELPYCESVKVNFVENDINTAPKLEKVEVVEAMYNFLKKLDVGKNCNGDGCVKSPLAPGLKDSIRLSVVTQRCLKKYLGNGEYEDFTVQLPEFVEDAAEYKKFMPVRILKKDVQ